MFWLKYFVLFSLVLVFSSANASTYIVPDNGNINDILISSELADGDTILIRSGNYHGDGYINLRPAKNIVIRSESGPDNTQISGGDNPVFMLDSMHAPTFTI